MKKKSEPKKTHRVVRFTLIAKKPSIACQCGFVYQMVEAAESRTHGQNALLDAYNIHLNTSGAIK